MTRPFIRVFAFVALLLAPAVVRAHAIMDLRARLSVPSFLAAGQTLGVSASADVLAFDPVAAVLLTIQTDAGQFTAVHAPGVWRCSREARRVQCVADEIGPGPHSVDLDYAAPASGVAHFSAEFVSIATTDPDISNNSTAHTSRVYTPSACTATAPAATSASTADGLTTFAWSAVAGARSYDVLAALDGESPRLVATTTDSRAPARLLGNGEVTWFVRASFDGCPELFSEPATFTSSAAGARLNLSTIASALLVEPASIALDGNLVLIWDAGARALRAYEPATGMLTDDPLFGDVSSGPIGGDGGITIGPGGFLYFADRATHLVRYAFPRPRLVVTAAGVAGTAGAADGLGDDARLRSPFGIAVDQASRVYVADSGNHTVRELAYVSPRGEFQLVTLAGATQSGYADGARSAARFNDPAGIAVDLNENLVVADRGNHVIRAVTRDGFATTIAGMAGQSGLRDGDAAQALFNRPAGIAVDPWGNIFVTEEGNRSVRKIAPNGRVTTVAGPDAGLVAPAMLAIDANGVLWIADPGNGTLRRGVLSVPVPKRRTIRH